MLAATRLSCDSSGRNCTRLRLSGTRWRGSDAVLGWSRSCLGCAGFEVPTLASGSCGGVSWTVLTSNFRCFFAGGSPPVAVPPVRGGGRGRDGLLTVGAGSTAEPWRLIPPRDDPYLAIIFFRSASISSVVVRSDSANPGSYLGLANGFCFTLWYSS